MLGLCSAPSRAKSAGADGFLSVSLRNASLRIPPQRHRGSTASVGAPGTPSGGAVAAKETADTVLAADDFSTLRAVAIVPVTWAEERWRVRWRSRQVRRSPR